MIENRHKKYTVKTSVMLLMVAQIFVFSIRLFYSSDETNTAMDYIISFLLQLGILTVALIFINSKESIRNIIPTKAKKLNKKQRKLLIYIALLTFVASLPLTLLFQIIVANTGYGITETETTQMMSIGTYMASFVLTVILAPFCEEILFRYAILKGLKGRGYIMAAFLTAFSFALMHGSLYQFLHQFIGGIVMCIVMQITDNIFAPMFIHFLNNLLSSLASIYLTFVLLGGFSLISVVFGWAGLIMALGQLVRLEVNKRWGYEIITQEAYSIRFSRTVHNIKLFITNRTFRKEAKLLYSATMERFDYDNNYEITIFNSNNEETPLPLITNKESGLTIYLFYLVIAFQIIVLFV